MLTSASASASSPTADANELTHFTFWDMDDTLIAIFLRIFKNAHVLLPTMLYQSQAPNQHLGILTNRSSDDEIRAEFPVEIALQILRGFGIDVPKSHVLFGGGEDNKPNIEDLHKLEIATTEIIRQIEMLKLTDHGEKVLGAETIAINLAAALDPLKDIKHRGKNYFLLKFLKEHFHKASQEYRFDTGVCHKDNFICGIVDDKRGIPESAEMLGKHFFGIKATDGGYPPKSATDRPDFYQDEYLFILAKIIGLDDYARSIVSYPEKHEKEDALLQISGLLYAWQAFPDMLNIKHFAKFEHCLSLNECEQVANMLAYIKCHANKHADAHYHPVDDLAECFNAFAIKKALIALNDVRDQITALNAKLATVSEPVVSAEPPAKGAGRLGMLFKSKSMGGASRSLPVPRVLAPADAKRLEELSQRETALAMQLTDLQQPDFDGIRQPVRITLEQAVARAKMAENPFQRSSSSLPHSRTPVPTRRASAIPSSSSSQELPAFPVAPVLIVPSPAPILIARPPSRERSSDESRGEDEPFTSVAPTNSERKSGSAIIGRRSGKK